MNDNSDKILIVGLGLIGGSYAMGLTKAGKKVYGYNRNKSAIDYAISHNIIIDGSDKFDKDFISQFDRIIFSIYPRIFKEYIDKYGAYIKDNAIISDVTGVKESAIMLPLLPSDHSTGNSLPYVWVKAKSCRDTPRRKPEVSCRSGHGNSSNPAD